MATKSKTTRTIRMKKQMTGKKSKPRTETQIIRACGPKGVDIPEVAAGLLEVEVDLLIDKSSERDALVKDNKKVVDLIKKLLREYAEQNATTQRAGARGSAMSIGSSSTSEVGTATELATLLKKHGKLNLFDDMVTVKIGEVKKYIDEKILIKEGFLTIHTNKYSSVSLKRSQ